MHIFKTVTTISLALLICISTANATTEDSTDIRESIINSLSRNHQEYLGYQSSTIEMYRNYSNNRNASNAPELHLLGGEYFNHDIIINGLSFRNPITGVTEASFSSSFFNNINIYQGNIPVNFSNANSAVIELSSPKLMTGFHGSFEALSDNFTGNKFDQNYYRGMFSGSLFDNNNLRFWSAFERKWLGDRMPSSLTSDVLDGSPDILPNNQLSGWTYHGKLQYELSSKSLFTITADGSIDEWQEYRHYFNNPDQPNQIAHTPRNKDENFGLNALLEHKLSENTDVNLSIGYFKSEHIDGDGVIFDDLASYSRDFSNPAFDNYYLFREGRIAPDDQFYEAYYSGFQHHISTYKQFRGEINHIYNEIHQIKAGLLYKRYNLRYFNHSLATLQNGSTVPEALYLNRYGFDADGNESDNETYKNNAKAPKEISLYFNDILSLEKISIIAGVRIDAYDYNALKFKNPERPFDPDGSTPADLTLDESDLVATKIQTSVSPNFGLNAQTSKNLNFYFNWSQNYQIAPYQNMYLGLDYFENRLSAGFYSVYPSLLIKPTKSETIIVGIQNRLNNQTIIDFNISDVEFSKQIEIMRQSPSVPFEYTSYENSGSASYIGYNLNVQYNYKEIGWFIDVTKSLISSFDIPNSDIGWRSTEGTLTSERPLYYDRDYKFVAGASVKTLLGLKINIIVKEESGFLYTPSLVYDAVSFISYKEMPSDDFNSSETEKSRVVDLKLEKELNLSGFKITSFILVKNLTDKQIVTGVYSATGSPTNTGYLETSNGQDYIEKYNFAQNNPLNFYAPRQIFFGIKTSF